jgi:hypothetical protein
MAEIDDLLERSAENFRDHGQRLREIPPRRRDASLQIYFW